ncbi:hypothetical protein [Sediminicola sp. 1XM1-17]|uniref:hypothetical protein n=1 Tax=Sediminicola sp. 1XM1-17 TaxID=3127702 RepID=UPI0030773271
MKAYKRNKLHPLERHWERNGVECGNLMNGTRKEQTVIASRPQGSAAIFSKELLRNILSLRAERSGGRQSHHRNLEWADCFTAFAMTAE